MAEKKKKKKKVSGAIASGRGTKATETRRYENTWPELPLKPGTLRAAKPKINKLRSPKAKAIASGRGTKPPQDGMSNVEASLLGINPPPKRKRLKRVSTATKKPSYYSLKQKFLEKPKGVTKKTSGRKKKK